MDPGLTSNLSLVNSLKEQIAIQAFQHKPDVSTLISGARHIVWLIDEIACLGKNREDPVEIFNG